MQLSCRNPGGWILVQERGFIQCKTWDLPIMSHLNPGVHLEIVSKCLLRSDLMVFTPLGRWINNMIAWHRSWISVFFQPALQNTKMHQAHAVFEHIEFREHAQAFPSLQQQRYCKHDLTRWVMTQMMRRCIWDDFELIIYFYIIVYRCVSKIYLDTL